MVNRALSLSSRWLVLAQLLSGLARAQEPAQGGPRVLHAPPSTHAACADLAVSAALDHPEQVKTAWLVYTRGGEAREVPFRRATSGPYLATVPGAEVCESFAYAIEIELLDGARVAAFAHRGAPHEVALARPREAEREAALLERLSGRRSVLSASLEYADFGSTSTRTTQPATGATAPATPTTISDRYHRIEAGYTYRMLGAVAEFGIRGGVVRGTSVVPGETDRRKFDVGLNYGAPRVLLRATDWLHVEATMLTSVTEVGFSVGGGGALLLGDPWGSKFTLGLESIQVFGTRAYSRLDLPIARGVYVAPIVEVTDMPHADRTGVRLLLEGRAALRDGYGVSALVGYQARDASSGGVAGGVAMSYAF